MSVKIYTTRVCPYCNMAKNFLKQNKVEFEEIDVSNDQKAVLEMIEKSGQMGVPVIDINGKIIIGFNPDAIKEALEAK